MKTKALILCSLLIVPVVAPGCGDENASRSAVQGKVTLDGKPVEAGAIAMIPIDGTTGPATGGPIENGCYDIAAKDGAVVGWNRVEVRANRKTGKMIHRGMGGNMMVEEETEAVAARFNSESTLKVKINPGDNTADFQVESK